MKKISIVIPVYNVEKYIHQCMDSIINQTFKDIQIICIDDGSSDNCPLILDEYALKDSRIMVIHQENAGVSAARNAGIKIATGEYIIFPDSDDWMELDALENLWREAERTKADIVYGDFLREYEGMTKYVSSFPNPFFTTDYETIQALQCGIICCRGPKLSRPEFKTLGYLGGAPWRGIVRTSIIKENKLLFDPYLRGIGDDTLFNLEIYEYITSVAYVKCATYHWRATELSYTNGYKENLMDTYSRIVERTEKFIKEHNKHGLLVDAYYSRMMLYIDQSMVRYFKNKQNQKKSEERYLEIKSVLESEPYKTAKNRNPLKYYRGKRLKIKMSFLKCGLYRIYWMFAWRL